MSSIENRVVVLMKPPLRYAISKELGMVGGPEIRLLVLEALEARGWAPEKIEAEYAKYVVHCYENDLQNEYASAAAVA